MPSPPVTYGCVTHPQTTNLKKNECCVHRTYANAGKRLEHPKKSCRFMKAGRKFLRSQLERSIDICPPCAIAAYEGYCERASDETMYSMMGDEVMTPRQEAEYNGTRCPGCGVIITARTWCSFKEHTKGCDIIGLLKQYEMFEWWVDLHPRIQALRSLEGGFDVLLAAWRRTHPVQAD
ncbi:hypothetical protein BKA62DRAFT_690102 [Auriculariales sp. MPI-PUGE-AT-0066]|nr:hypothetical protein BKA62DRAFT_690102 [Auriculariales sp. MPI-PUGE-AT-0066]